MICSSLFFLLYVWCTLAYFLLNQTYGEIVSLIFELKFVAYYKKHNSYILLFTWKGMAIGGK